MTNRWTQLAALVKGAAWPRPLPPVSYPVTLPALGSNVRGRVLFSYLTDCLTWPDEDPRLSGHSNQWECRTIVEIFRNMGFAVEAIRWDDHQIRPSGTYDVIFDISTNLPRLASLVNNRPLLMLHRSGSEAFYQNAAEMRRVSAMEQRRGGLYFPKRLVAFPELERKALEMADSVTLLGNQHTLTTYPEESRPKIRLVPVTASDVRHVAKTQDYVPDERHFLCFCGYGAVHKGVDLLLEVFRQYPEYTLHIVNPADSEPDFRQAYRNELENTPNIRNHGFLKTNSAEFRNVTRQCFCFVLPSCSEGTSTAAVTCMQIGLLPILSRESGVTLLNGCGRYLETCSQEEIAQVIKEVASEPSANLLGQIKPTQAYAAKTFSREVFRMVMTKAIEETLQRRPTKR